MKEAFKQILSETKGDIYKHMGDMEKSFKYYNEAIDDSAINNENLLMKYNSVKNIIFFNFFYEFLLNYRKLIT